MKHIVLIGFMGAGKTSVGKRLARLSGREFVDTDCMIEGQQGRTINEIFEKDGEPYFRDLETDALRQLLDEKKARVIAVGGGLPVREENRELLRKLGTVVYLQADIDTLVGRLEGDTTRPKLKGGSLRARIESLMRAREAIYEDAAAVKLHTDQKTVDQTAREILAITLSN